MTGRECGSRLLRYMSVPALSETNGGEKGFGPKVDSFGRKKRFFGSTQSLTGFSTNEKLRFNPTISTILDNESTTRNHLQSRGNESFGFAFSTGSGNSGSNGSSNDGGRLKEDTSAMTQANSVCRGPAEPDGSAGAPILMKNTDSAEVTYSSRSSKGRQKKFHRHFQQVDVGEKVLNYYSCALVGDILLQGHLYITENFFAFYSNVFGYVTKLLIPTSDVLKISKEKTAKIIPNAIGISTEDEKHVFGSLLSRDSTYKFMLEVWKASSSSNPAAKIPSAEVIKNEPSDDDSSISTGNEEPSSFMTNLTSGASSDNLKELLPRMKRRSLLLAKAKMERLNRRFVPFGATTIFVLAVALFAFLFASAGYLLYRIAQIQNHFGDLSFTTRGDVYEKVLEWQSTLHSSSAMKIQEFLTTNLNQIVKIRLSLEALSVLMMPKKNESEKSNSRFDWENSDLNETGEKMAMEKNSPDEKRSE